MMKGSRIMLEFAIASLCAVSTANTNVLTNYVEDLTCNPMIAETTCSQLQECQWVRCATVPSTCRSKKANSEMFYGNDIGVTDMCSPRMQLPQSARPPTPPPLIPTVMFNDSFSSNMVLQQQPAMAAVYGTSPNATGVTIQVSGATVDDSYSVNANMTGNGNWKAFLKPTTAGGDYTITAVCTGCQNKTNAVLANVVFGDVWYCAGQSNMWLPLSYTYHRNYTVANITAGNLDNIRLMAGNSGTGTFHPWMTAKQSIAMSNATAEQYTLFQFSGACWYFAEGLAMKMAEQVKSGNADAMVPIGLISTAIGGSMIEEWTTNTTTATCQNVSIAAHNEMLWNEKVVPYLGMTMKGFLWYQGENNMHGMKGNSIDHTGYGCQMPTMVKLWRENWSTVAGTTDPDAPFGLVALPSSGSEGGSHMGAMRWAQTANYGTLPNVAMTNSFLAQAYDLNDPWGDKTCYEYECCWNHYNKSACSTSLVKRGFQPTDCDYYCSILQGTNVYMGGIHPRIKQPVGYRLAAAAMAEVYGATSDPVSGPQIAGCSADMKTLTVTMDTSLLKSDSVIVQPYNHSLSNFQVLTNASLFCVEAQLRCLPFPNGTTPMPPCQGTTAEMYCPETDLALPYPALTGHGAADPFEAAWITAAVLPGNGKDTVTIDLSTINGTVAAIRYAFSGDCCQGNGITTPCAIKQCPIMGSPSNLPANPFIARVKSGKCECVAPQTCNQ